MELSFFSIIKQNIEAARNGNKDLLKLLVGMTRSGCTARDIVEVVDAFDFEWHMYSTFDKCQVSPWIVNLRQFNLAAIF